VFRVRVEGFWLGCEGKDGRFDLRRLRGREKGYGPFFKLPASLKSTNTDPSAASFEVTGDATPDRIRVVRSVLGAISSLPIGGGLDLQRLRRRG